MTSAISGKWVYRSYLNEPTIVRQNAGQNDPENAKRALGQIWGEGQVEFGELKAGKFDGKLEFAPGVVLDLTGKVGSSSAGEPSSLEAQATGRAGTPTAGWTSRIHGWFVPMVAEGKNQIPAVVGAVVSTAAGPVKIDVQPVGTVGSFILVRSS